MQNPGNDVVIRIKYKQQPTFFPLQSGSTHPVTTSARDPRPRVAEQCYLPKCQRALAARPVVHNQNMLQEESLAGIRPYSSLLASICGHMDAHSLRSHSRG